MTWARNLFIVATAFLMGLAAARDGWQRFAVTQVWIVLLTAVVVTVWFLINKAERRVKGKPDSELKIREPSTGNTANVPLRFCPKCGVRLATGAFAHVETCHGSAA